MTFFHPRSDPVQLSARKPTGLIEYRHIKMIKNSFKIIMYFISEMIVKQCVIRTIYNIHLELHQICLGIYRRMFSGSGASNRLDPDNRRPATDNFIANKRVGCFKIRYIPHPLQWLAQKTASRSSIAFHG